MGQATILDLLKNVWPLWLDSASISVNLDINRVNVDTSIKKLLHEKDCEIEIKFIKVTTYYSNSTRFVRYKYNGKT